MLREKTKVAEETGDLRNLKVLRPQDGKPSAPSKYDIDFHGRRFLFRVEGNACGIDVKYVQLMPARSLIPEELRGMPVVMNVPEDKMIERDVLGRHVHLKPWMRLIPWYAEWRVLSAAHSLRKTITSALFFDDLAAKFKEQLG